MSVEHIEVLVEEPSMEAFLRVLLPRLLGSISFEIHPFEGKHALLRKLPARLRGYAGWLPQAHRILVIVDRDDDDCLDLKRRLDHLAVDPGLIPKSLDGDGPYNVINRLAVEELEAWYFGDWDAVCRAYPAVSATVVGRAAYRHSDEIVGGTWEAFEREMQRARYFTTGLRKVEAAAAIAPHLEPSRNRSPSFCALRDVLFELAST